MNRKVLLACLVVAAVGVWLAADFGRDSDYRASTDTDGMVGHPVRTAAKRTDAAANVPVVAPENGSEGADQPGPGARVSSSLPDGNGPSLNYDERQAIQSIAFDTVYNTDLASVGLIESIQCSGQDCELEVALFEARESGRKSSEIMERLNDGLRDNPATRDVQMSLRSINPDGQGGASLSLVAQDRNPPTHNIEFIKENGRLIGIRSEKVVDVEEDDN